MKKVFITGSNGFLGKALVSLLKKQNIGITEGTRTQYGEFSQFTGWDKLLAGHEGVIHLAARVHIMDDKSPDPLEAFRQVNVQGTLNLARAAKVSGVKRFIFISSVKVNGEETTEIPFSASDIPAPQDPYGISKMEAENELMKLHEKDIFEVVIIRPPLIYGQGVKANFKNLMNLVTKKIPLPFGIVNNRRSLVSVLNLSDLIIHSLDHPNAGGEVFLVSDDHDYSLTEIIQRIGNVLGFKPRLLKIPVSWMKLGLKILGKQSYANRLFGNLHVDIEKTKRVLGWKPKYSFEDTFNY